MQILSRGKGETINRNIIISDHVSSEVTKNRHSQSGVQLMRKHRVLYSMADLRTSVVLGSNL